MGSLQLSGGGGSGSGDLTVNPDAVKAVFHGAVAGTARPTWAGTVLWVGTVEPTNMDAARDLYFAPVAGGGSSFVGALDGMTTPNRALSLRRVLSTYTGPLVRVRRSSDSTEADIGYVSATGLLDETALLAHVGAGSGYVTKWYDQSGSARDLAQATTGAQPRIVNAGVVDKINAKPAVIFDGTDDFLFSTVTGLYAAGHASLAAVMSGAPASNSAVVSEHSLSPGSLYRMLRSSTAAWNVQASNDASASMWANTAAGDTTFNSTQHRLFYADTGTAVSTWKDNVAVHAAITATRSGAVTMARFSVGAQGATTPANFYNGAIQELLTYASDETANRAALYTAQAYWTT